MRRLLYPAVTLMNRLTYVKKFILIGVLFMLPIMLTMNLLVAGIDKQIFSASKEKRGVEYSMAVRQLMEHVQQHRGMLNGSLKGDTAFAELLSKRRGLIQQAINNLEQVDGKLGAELKTTEQWQEIRNDLQKLLANKPQLRLEQSFAEHTRLVSDLLLLLAHVADVSGLKLDPGGDSYRLMDMIAYKLPVMIETTGQIRGLGTGIAAKRHINAEERVKLIILSGTLEGSLGDLRMFGEWTESGEIKEKLRPFLDRHQADSDAFLELLGRELLSADAVTIEKELFYWEGTKAIESGYALYDMEIPILQKLLTERIEGLERQKQSVAAFAVFVFIVILYLFGAFYESIIRTVMALKKASIRFAAGDLTVRVQLHAKDELQEVGSSFNTMADAFSRMMDDRKQYEEKIVYQAYYDALTGLPNRVLLNDRLTNALTDARRRRKLLAVMFLDLDRFKLINDTLGHDIGDMLLKEVSKRLSDCLREEDTVSRMGGDEFLFVLPDIGEIDYARTAAEKILAVLAEPVRIDSHDLYISGSVGISMYPFDGDDNGNLIKNADTAMYAAKSQGRGCFRFFDKHMNERAERMLQIETNLRRALERQEFTLYYQPKFETASGKMTGLEALVRWKHPELGLVSPADFIPVAEELGLIIPLGEWVLRTACMQNKEWQDAGMAHVRISVNISTSQFQREDFYHTVGRILEETGLEPEWLELELTESVVMNNSAMATVKLKQLKELGIYLSIDDFGTGFSSLSYLKHFPIDTLKIDRSFIKDIPGAPKDTAITKTIIALGRRLGVRVVAEGVETKEQLAFLASRKCTEVQGYLLSRPMPAKAAGELLAKEQEPSAKKVLSASGAI